MKEKGGGGRRKAWNTTGAKGRERRERLGTRKDAKAAKGRASIN